MKYLLMKVKNNRLLLLILLVSFLLRVYQVGDNPPSLNWDEISHGYNAYSILNTGRDEWGYKFPLIFRAYGDFKLPLYIYLTVPWIFCFGLNSFSVRLTSILAGTGLVLVSYLITHLITKEKKTSLLAAALVSLSPWSLFLSRIAVEANLGAFLFSLGIFFLMKWWQKKEGKNLTPALIFFGLSLYAYNSARIIVPAVVLILLIYLFKTKKIKQSILPLLIFFIIITPFVFQVVNNSAKARYDLVSLIDQGTIGTINNLRNGSKLPLFFKRVIYNRPNFFVLLSIKNYFSNLSLDYLFFKGGSHYQFSLPNHELLFLISAPFLIFGIIWKLLKGDSSEKILILWFFLGFIPSAITKDAPHVLRSILVLPSPMIISSLGFFKVISYIKNKSFINRKFVYIVCALCLLLGFSKWWTDYWNIYRKSYSWAWQNGYKEMVSEVLKRYGGYSQIIITKKYGEPHEFLLFYSKYSPILYQQDKSKKWDYHANWYWIDAFGKYSFYNDWEADKIVCKSGACLLVASPGNYPKDWRKIKTITNINGETVFEILEK